MLVHKVRVAISAHRAFLLLKVFRQGLPSIVLGLPPSLLQDAFVQLLKHVKDELFLLEVLYTFWFVDIFLVDSF